MKLFISPHNDDAVLFGAFTLMRENPLVITITDSFIQSNRGENITADQRWLEDVEAMKILGCPIIRIGIRDDVIYPEIVKETLKRFEGFEKVYAPALQGGNKHHDLIAEAAKEVFGDRVTQYLTYSKDNLYTTGTQEVIPSEAELELKNKALVQYQSQINLPATAPHFEAVKGKSEWYI